MTHVSSSGIGAVIGSAATFPVPFADTGSFFYGEVSRDPLKESPKALLPTLSPRARLWIQRRANLYK
jgi:hypothetical protein